MKTILATTALLATSALIATVSLGASTAPVNTTPPAFDVAPYSHQLRADPGVWTDADALFAIWGRCDTNAQHCTWTTRDIDKPFNAGGNCDECTVRLTIVAVNDQGATVYDVGVYSFPPKK